MKILSARFLQPGKAHALDRQGQDGGFRLNNNSSFILPPSSFAFHAASQETSRPRQFQLALRRAGEAKMIRLTTRKNNRDTSREPKTNFRRFLARAIAVSVLSLFLSVLGLGQTSTSITGEIVDENGGKISGADVRLRSRSGVQFSTATAGNGSFEFRDLPSGQYLIEVQAEGFAKFVTDEIVVERGQAKQLQLKLKVAGNQ